MRVDATLSDPRQFARPPLGTPPAHVQQTGHAPAPTSANASAQPPAGRPRANASLTTASDLVLTGDPFVMVDVPIRAHAATVSVPSNHQRAAAPSQPNRPPAPSSQDAKAARPLPANNNAANQSLAVPAQQTHVPTQNAPSNVNRARSLDPKLMDEKYDVRVDPLFALVSNHHG